ncbi:alpha/beta hydrolase [Pseudoduganella ginsengisoli]|uniref:Alpha/beta fold hydrolase n=1 Tax=Pseudoduganella ginsengisoli TaxID=1462440 RepID=A0A6L6Q0V2_9BURK|nr:alpha/beta hydrolase [Pseudoduganella ginsengisoli]MTW03064.1 alpha/beta fold hydrolase [Pseudoduganella ginsengisoli]
MNATKLLSAITFAVSAAFAALPQAHAEGSITAAQGTPAKPTIVFVHGAFADSSSWDGVAKKLAGKGYPVLSVANPLRGVGADARYAANVIQSVKGPVVLVGHSYGGMVISKAAENNPDVKALVYVAAFAPEQGETVAGLAHKFPGSTLGQALADPVSLDDGKDLYIRQDKFRAQFAADVPAPQAALMAAGQRPIAVAALEEPATGTAWKQLPSYFVYGSGDRNIPSEAFRFMAQRAGAKDVREVKGASHVVMVSHPDVVAQVIEEAAVR